MKPGSKGWKNLMAKLYGIGASIVIIGALFKINHYPGADVMLLVGLTTEAIIFFFSAFEPPHEDPDWSLVYPELATPGDAGKLQKEPTKQLDDMLSKANIDEALISRLGDGMRHLGDQAAKMGEAADVGAAAQNYSDSLAEASNHVKELSASYQHVSESLTGLKNAGDMSDTVGAAMQQMSDNLTSLNDMYAGQLKQLQMNSQLYSSMGELVQNLNDSVEDTKSYKENIAELAKNLSSLNTVYSNMLNAMGR
ncbi:MAG: gliding motility protein GldL [Bacteroidetes bacterium]|nr:gliding motility protein GldL [Bacteroidota bacterium]